MQVLKHVKRTDKLKNFINVTCIGISAVLQSNIYFSFILLQFIYYDEKYIHTVVIPRHNNCIRRSLNQISKFPPIYASPPVVQNSIHTHIYPASLELHRKRKLQSSRLLYSSVRDISNFTKIQQSTLAPCK